MVWVRALIDEDGRVRRTHVHKTEVGPTLQVAAAEVALKWRFEPARCEGEAVPFVVVIPFSFTPPARPKRPPGHPSSSYMR